MKIVPVVPSSSSEGVIIEPLARQVSPSKSWCMTWNNYPDNWKDIIVPKFQNLDGYIIGEEVGESGTPHLQGYIQFKNKSRPFGLQLPKVINWLAAKGTKEQNIKYCSKDGKWIAEGNCITTPKYEIFIELYEWQHEIVKILNQKPDDRSIYWYWEEEGCAGKTTFQKWIYLNFKNVAVLCGKATDMKNGIVAFQEKNKILPEIVLINIPRCQDKEHISWQGIEEIKDMFFFSGKYEGGMICGPNPHTMIFSNEEPPIYKLTEDRWKIRNIRES